MPSAVPLSTVHKWWLPISGTPHYRFVPSIHIRCKPDSPHDWGPGEEEGEGEGARGREGEKQTCRSPTFLTYSRCLLITEITCGRGCLPTSMAGSMDLLAYWRSMRSQEPPHPRWMFVSPDQSVLAVPDKEGRPGHNGGFLFVYPQIRPGPTGVSATKPGRRAAPSHTCR